MPTYEYICRECGHQFEVFQNISAEALSVCPECGGVIHRKISGGAGLVFKGSGFYITDYKKNQAVLPFQNQKKKKPLKKPAKKFFLLKLFITFYSAL